jgi:hypothetical protein
MSRHLPYPLRSIVEFDLLCTRHLSNTIDSLQSQVRDRLRHAERAVLTWSLSTLETSKQRWKELLDGYLLTSTYRGACTACAMAIEAQEPRTVYFLEGTMQGRMVCVTSAPFHDLDQFRNYLNESHGDYFGFIAPLRGELHAMPNWESRDFVHWLFLADSCHLLYKWSSTHLSLHAAMWVLVGQESIAIHQIGPVELVDSLSELSERIRKHDQLWLDTARAGGEPA